MIYGDDWLFFNDCNHIRCAFNSRKSSFNGEMSLIHSWQNMFFRGSHGKSHGMFNKQRCLHNFTTHGSMAPWRIPSSRDVEMPSYFSVPEISFSVHFAYTNFKFTLCTITTKVDLDLKLAVQPSQIYPGANVDH